jgi:hypothetical protein
MLSQRNCPVGEADGPGSGLGKQCRETEEEVDSWEEREARAMASKPSVDPTGSRMRTGLVWRAGRTKALKVKHGRG